MNAYAEFPAKRVLDACEYIIDFHSSDLYAIQKEFISDLKDMAKDSIYYHGEDAVIRLDVVAYRLVKAHL